MSLKFCIALAIITISLAPNAQADTYSAFQKKRFYSANRRYFVEVKENKRAVLYRNGRSLRRIWTSCLPELPDELFVTDDGSRMAMVDFYYGNQHNPDAPVVIFFGEKGKEIARYLLKEVANLSRITVTTSMAFWYEKAKLMDGQILSIDTIVAKFERSKCGNIKSAAEAEQMLEICTATVPYEKLSFDMVSGKLIIRESVVPR